jgi:hypothetical protein
MPWQAVGRTIERAWVSVARPVRAATSFRGGLNAQREPLSRRDVKCLDEKSDGLYHTARSGAIHPQ